MGLLLGGGGSRYVLRTKYADGGASLNAFPVFEFIPPIIAKDPCFEVIS